MDSPLSQCTRYAHRAQNYIHMKASTINRLSLLGIDYHHTTDIYVAFTLQGWKYVQVPIGYAKSYQSIVNYLNY